MNYFIKLKVLTCIFISICALGQKVMADDNQADDNSMNMSKYSLSQSSLNALRSYQITASSLEGYGVLLNLAINLAQNQNEGHYWMMNVHAFRSSLNHFLKKFKSENGREPTQVEVLHFVLEQQGLTIEGLQTVLNNAEGHQHLKRPVKKQKLDKSGHNRKSLNGEGDVKKSSQILLNAALKLRQEEAAKAKEIEERPKKRAENIQNIQNQAEVNVTAPWYYLALTDALTLLRLEGVAVNREQRMQYSDNVKSKKAMIGTLLEAFQFVFHDELNALTVDHVWVRMIAQRNDLQTLNHEFFARAVYQFLWNELGGADAGLDARIAEAINQQVNDENALAIAQARAVFEVMHYQNEAIQPEVLVFGNHLATNNEETEENDWIIVETDATPLATVIYEAALRAVRQSVFDILIPGTALLLGVQLHEDYHQASF